MVLQYLTYWLNSVKAFLVPAVAMQIFLVRRLSGVALLQAVYTSLPRLATLVLSPFQINFRINLSRTLIEISLNLYINLGRRLKLPIQELGITLIQILFISLVLQFSAYNSSTYFVQFSSDAQSCLTFCDPMNCSTPGPPVHHQLPEFTQTHVHQVGDAVLPSHLLSSPSPPAPNPSQHQGLFQLVNSSHFVRFTLYFMQL